MRRLTVFKLFVAGLLFAGCESCQPLYETPQGEEVLFVGGYKEALRIVTKDSADTVRVMDVTDREMSLLGKTWESEGQPKKAAASNAIVVIIDSEGGVLFTRNAGVTWVRADFRSATTLQATVNGVLVATEFGLFEIQDDSIQVVMPEGKLPRRVSLVSEFGSSLYYADDLGSAWRQGWRRTTDYEGRHYDPIVSFAMFCGDNVAAITKSGRFLLIEESRWEVLGYKINSGKYSIECDTLEVFNMVGSPESLKVLTNIGLLSARLDRGVRPSSLNWVQTAAGPGKLYSLKNGIVRVEGSKIIEVE